MPPVPPAIGTSTRLRLARDNYVRIAGNDYSVDPCVIGRFVDVHAALATVVVTCAGQVVARHERSWAAREHAAAAAQPAPAAGAAVALRALSDYDAIFALTAPEPATRPSLQVVR